MMGLTDELADYYWDQALERSKVDVEQANAKLRAEVQGAYEAGLKLANEVTQLREQLTLAQAAKDQLARDLDFVLDGRKRLAAEVSNLAAYLVAKGYMLPGAEAVERAIATLEQQRTMLAKCWFAD